ncbi:MAG: PleD family two-component system response regulator [Henriciella sp.]|nr:PleD family two-component system response regulator [Henriciella sp.]
MSARVLVVDDVPSNRRLMQATLEAKYYTVLLAEDGPQALSMTYEYQPDIILLDVMMPGMDGYEVCRRLKADPRTSHIPIVMLTALHDADDRINGLRAGADDFLSKPMDDFALMARLDALTRYNTVAAELRQRDATVADSSALTPDEREELERPANVLIIETDANEADRLAAPLREFGHRVMTWQESLTDGSEQPGRLDVAILALSGQNHDAKRLCASLRSMYRTGEVSIIVTYEPYDKLEAIEALRLGAGDVVAQPVDALELLARVKTQLRRSRYVEILRRRVDRGLELSLVDQLTGLYNRRFMLAQLRSWMHRAQSGGLPVSIAAFDIDYFKRINDDYGHPAGDSVLKEFADRLRLNVRPKDLVCRPGGEEFLIILPETDLNEALQGAERVREAIAGRSFRLEQQGVDVKITVSAGVATSGPGNETLAELLEEADRALYRAKQLGRNRIEEAQAA